MDTRAKLINLLTHDIPSGDHRGALAFSERVAGVIADHLIANGAMVQEWIPVEERLPETYENAAGTRYSEAVMVWTSGSKAMIAVYDGIDFLCAARYWEAEGERITHWMPLPQPPKGVE